MAGNRNPRIGKEEEEIMDPFNPYGGVSMQAPQLPKPKKPKKPDPAARRMKQLDYVSLLLGVEPPPPDANLPPPIGYRFPDQEIERPFMPPHLAVPPSYHPPQQAQALPEQYKNHVMRMRMKLGY